MFGSLWQTVSVIAGTLLLLGCARQEQSSEVPSKRDEHTDALPTMESSRAEGTSEQDTPEPSMEIVMPVLQFVKVIEFGTGTRTDIVSHMKLWTETNNYFLLYEPPNAHSTSEVRIRVGPELRSADIKQIKQPVLRALTAGGGVQFTGVGGFGHFFFFAIPFTPELAATQFGAVVKNCYAQEEVEAISFYFDADNQFVLLSLRRKALPVLEAAGAVELLKGKGDR